MKITISNQTDVNKFANIFKNIGSLNELFKLEFTSEGITGQAMDNAHICLFELKISAEWFDEYTVDENFDIGIAALQFSKVIQCLKEDQKIVMHMNETDDRLCIDLIGEKGINKYFELTSIDLDIEKIDIPSSEYDADIELKSELFTELVDQMSMFHDSLHFRCNDEFVHLSSSGDTGKMAVKINDDDILMYAIEENTEINLSFSLLYFQKMCLFRKLATSMTIHLNSEKPMNMIYRLDDSSSEDTEPCKNYLQFFLASKIEDD